MKFIRPQKPLSWLFPRMFAIIIFLGGLFPFSSLLNRFYAFPTFWYLPVQLSTLALILFISIYGYFLRLLFGYVRRKITTEKLTRLFGWWQRWDLNLWLMTWSLTFIAMTLISDLGKLEGKLVGTPALTDVLTALAHVGVMLVYLIWPPQGISRSVLSALPPLENRLLTWLKPRLNPVFQAAQNWWLWFRPLSPIQKVAALRWVIIAVIMAGLVKTFGASFIPPQIVATFPTRNGEATPLDSAIEIQFDRPMKALSMTGGIKITPPIAADISWENNSRLVIIPKENYQRQTTYKVEFTKPIVSSFWVPVINPKPVEFSTVGHPVVSLATPQQEAADEVPVITVLFDRPMVPLKTQADRAELAPAFTIDPPILGEGRWLGTSSYQFRPSQKLPPGTTFTYKVAAGLKSADGGELQQDAIFSFSTIRPRVEKVVPTNAYEYANPTASVAAILNLPVNKKAADTTIEVVESNSGKKVDGTVKVIANRIGFYATGGLKRETEYKATVKAGLLATTGQNGLETDYSWTFKTIPLPKAIGSEPTHGATGIDEMYQVLVNFVSPMDEASLEKNIVISPASDAKTRVNFSTYKSMQAMISTYLQRSTRYRITVLSSATDIYGTPLGRDFSFEFETGPFKPSISLVPAGNYFAAFNQTIAPRIVAKVTNTPTVTYRLYKLSRNDFLELYRLRNFSSNYQLSNWQTYDPSKLQLVKTWSEQFESNQNVPVNVITKVEPGGGSLYPSGFYFLDASLDSGAHDNLVMIVSQATLSLKAGRQNQYLAWAVNQTQAQPVGGMKLEFMNEQGTLLHSATTGEDGVVKFDKDLKLDAATYNHHLLVFGEKDGDTTLVTDSMNSGIERYNFNLAHYYDPQESDRYNQKTDYKIHLTLDRPIYRPGQTVNYKGVVREDTGKALELVKNDPTITVMVTDGDGKQVEIKTVKLTSYGTFDGAFNLSSDSSVGYYSISASLDGNEFSQQFQVEEYVPAAFETKVTTDDDRYVSGDRAAVGISGNYYFGAPVANAAVNWSLTTDTYYYTWYRDVGYEFGAADYYDYRPWWSYANPDYFSGELVTQGEGKLNDQGQYQVAVPISVGTSKTDQLIRVEAVVKNKDSEVIAGSKDVIVTAAGIRTGIKPATYSGKTNEPVSVDVITLDLKDKEKPGMPVKITFYKREWSTVKEYDEDSGDYYWTSKPNDRQIGEPVMLTTNETGRGSASFVPTDGGTYRVVAEGTDLNGRISTGATYVWVSGYDAYARYQNNDRVLLIPDKAEYSVGDTAQVQAVIPYDDVIGLLTTERDSVYRYQLVNLSRDQKIMSFGLSDEDSPNIYVSGLFVKGGTGVKDPPQLKMGITELRVKNPKKQLAVSIEPDKTKYKPAETASIRFQVKNGAGEPVKTELAVAVVDQSVWALSGIKLADIFETFYRPKNHEVDTSSLLTIALDRINATLGLGSKGGSGGGCFAAETAITMADGSTKPIAKIAVGDQIRSVEASPSVWQRLLSLLKYPVTLPSDQSTVTKLLIHDVDSYVKLMLDSGDLVTTSVHRFFTGRGWLAVSQLKPGDRTLDQNGIWRTVIKAETIAAPIRVYNLEVEPAHTYFANGILVHNQKGGGELTNRNNFQDTAYWNGRVETDANGQAEIKVKLADNTTTWRVFAQGVTKDSAVGQTVSTVIATKDVLIRPLLPRFASVGDTPKLGFSIHNQSDTEAQISAKMIADNFSFDGGAEQTVTVPAKSEKNVYWTGTVTAGDQLKLSITAKQDGVLLDGIDKTLPVHTYYTQEVVAVAGDTANQATQTITKPSDVVPDMGSLLYSVSPVMGLASITSSVDYFYHYAYWCVEQSSSRILSLAPLIKLDNSSQAVLDNTQKATADNLIKDAIQRLVKGQKVSGGWAYWPDDMYEPNPYSSSLAMEALYRAKAAGYTVDQSVTNNGLQYLRNVLNQPSLSYTDQAMVARTISLYEPVAGGILTNLMNRRWEMSAPARADLLTAMDLSRTGAADRNRLYNELMSLMKKTNTIVHFEERSRGYNSNNMMLTASVMDAIARRDQFNPILPEILRYYDSVKKQGYWRSTRETAVVTAAVADLIDRRGDLKGSFDWNVAFNNQDLKQGKFEPKLGTKQVADVIPLSQVKPGDNQLTFKKSGNGNLYYNLNYTYFLLFSEVPAREQGLVLLRELVDENGKIMASNQLKQGNEYRVRLTLAASQTVTHVMVEDLLPAGLEPVNESLATTGMSSVKTMPLRQETQADLKKPEYEGEATSHLYVSHQEMRDDRVVLYVQTVYPGVYEYTYRVHAGIPGKFHYPAASAYNMYVPEINGHSDGSWLVISDN